MSKLVDPPPLSKRIIVRLNDSAYAFTKTLQKPTAFYFAKCPLHGYFIDYKHGHQGKLRCPKGDYEVATEASL